MTRVEELIQENDAMLDLLVRRKAERIESIPPEAKPIPVAIVSYHKPLGNRVFKALYADGTRSYLAEDYANYLAHENNITITYAGE